MKLEISIQSANWISEAIGIPFGNGGQVSSSIVVSLINALIQYISIKLDIFSISTILFYSLLPRSS